MDRIWRWRHRPLPEKSLFFRDTREHPEHDAKNRLSISNTGSEKTLAEIESVKRKLTLTNFVSGAFQQRIFTPSNKIEIWKTRIWAVCSSSTTWYPIKSWYFRNYWNRKYFWSRTSATRIASFGPSGSRKSRWATFGCSTSSCPSSRGRRLGIQIAITTWQSLSTISN